MLYEDLIKLKNILDQEDIPTETQQEILKEMITWISHILKRLEKLEEYEEGEFTARGKFNIEDQLKEE